MNPSVFWALVRKDLYLLRGFMMVMVVAGALAALVMAYGRTGYAVGGVLFITADVASGIFIAMYSLRVERKALARLFALSLPISGFHYEMSKLVSSYLAYGIPWLLLSAIALGVQLLPGADRGMIVYVLVLQAFVLALFGVILAAMFVTTSEAMSGVIIVVTNICFSLFMVELNQPQISSPFHSATLVWTPFAHTAVTAAAGVIAFSLLFVWFFASRRRDYL